MDDLRERIIKAEWMIPDPIDAEHNLLRALAWMCQQYIGDAEGNSLDHMCMGAGEDAVALLYRYGYVDSLGRGAAWTEAGRALLNSN